MKPVRIIQCYTGEIARDQIRMIVEHPRLELVGAMVHHAEKVGLDAGELAGIEANGVITVNAIEEILAIDADIVLYNPPHERYDEVIRFLEHGFSVITPTGGCYPKLVAEFGELEAACARGQSVFTSSGINPGYAPDLLAMVSTAICSRVDHVHVFADGQVSNSAQRIAMMGFGSKPEQAALNELFIQFAIPAYKQATYLLAEGLGLTLSSFEHEASFCAADRDIDGECPIKAGEVAATRLSTYGLVDSERRITLETTWFVSRKAIDAEWLGRARSLGWTIEVSGRPDVSLSLDVELGDAKGSELTAARIINTIPFVIEAQPGVMTMLDGPIPRAWT